MKGYNNVPKSLRKRSKLQETMRQWFEGLRELRTQERCNVLHRLRVEFYMVVNEVYIALVWENRRLWNVMEYGNTCHCEKDGCGEEAAHGK